MLVVFSGCSAGSFYTCKKDNCAVLNIALWCNKSNSGKIKECLKASENKKTVLKKLGRPSFKGRALSGDEFWRYEGLGIEVYFKGKFVYGVRRIDTRP